MPWARARFESGRVALSRVAKTKKKRKAHHHIMGHQRRGETAAVAAECITVTTALARQVWSGFDHSEMYALVKLDSSRASFPSRTTPWNMVCATERERKSRGETGGEDGDEKKGV